MKQYVILAGAPKSGTSTIFDNLSKHPAICPSNVKETYYFLDKNISPLYNKESNFANGGLEGFEKYFSNCEHLDTNIYLEATPDYIYHKTPIIGLSSFDPKPKIIFILRKPSNRAYSVFQFAKNNLSIIHKSVTFEEFIYKVRNQEEFDTPFSNVLLKTLEYGKYVKYLDLWLKRFDRSSIQIYLFEDYVKDNVSFMSRLSRDIKISDDFWNDYIFSKSNSSYQIKNQLLQKIYIKIAKQQIFGGQLKLILKHIYFSVNATKYYKQNSIDCALLKELDELYHPHNENLKYKYCVDLSPWD